TVPFGSLDAYNNTAPWSNFSTIKQGFGERTLTAPTASLEQGAFDKPFDLTLTNNNEGGTIYYYIVNEGDGASDVRTVETYSAPIKISNTCKVVAYISDGTICCDPVSLDYTRTKHPVSTNAELIAMEADMLYEVNVVLEGVKVNGGVLYARTKETSAAPSEPRTEHIDHGYDQTEDINKLDNYNQRDWVAIEGLTSDYEGFEVGSFVAAYDGVKLTPVASAPAKGDSPIDVMNINTFSVPNVFYGNYVNTLSLGWKDGDGNQYEPFYVKAKVNEVANYAGTLKQDTNEEGASYRLEGSGKLGVFEGKGVLLEPASDEIRVALDEKLGQFQIVEGVLVADAEANGGVKLVALAGPEDAPTGVTALKADGKATIYGTEGAVVVTGAEGKVMIFNAMGRLVKIVNAEGDATVAMPAGYYIVRTADSAAKVIVK
ncbi:MAG: DUF6383 domain-containing protein, partial [Muribaculaceae bacterium]